MNGALHFIDLVEKHLTKAQRRSDQGCRPDHL